MSRKILVQNLNYSEKEESIKSHFERAGKISKIRLFRDNKNQSKGIAYIKYKEADDAKRAVNMFTDTVYSGRRLKVELFNGERNEENEDRIEERLDVIEKKLDEVIRLLKSNHENQKNADSNSEDGLINFINLIPIGQTWNIDSPTKNTLTYNGNFYIVEVSNVDRDNQETHYPYFLFNGINETHGGNRWATDSYQDIAYIKIRFSRPIVANVLTMTARNGEDSQQAPTSFEIFGIKQNEASQSLNRFDEVIWTPNLNLTFQFNNRNSYSAYKIVFYESNFPTQYFGLSELNLGTKT